MLTEVPYNVPIRQDALLDLTHRGEIVLNPFLGSGPTDAAAPHLPSIAPDS